MMTVFELQDFRKITDYYRGIYGIYLKVILKKTKDHNHTFEQCYDQHFGLKWEKVEF